MVWILHQQVIIELIKVITVVVDIHFANGGIREIDQLIEKRFQFFAEFPARVAWIVDTAITVGVV